MADRKKPKGDYEVGYGRPPKSGQFAPGTSGNLTGRPPKAKAEPASVPKYRPTQKLIRTSGERIHKLRVNGKLTDMTEREATLQSVFQSALRGSPMAQRTYLYMQMEEDRRLAAEQEEVFKSWEEYHDMVRPLFDASRAAGKPEPDLLPHPDDIRLDYGERSVVILGPRNEKEAEKYALGRKCAELWYELMHFLDELSHGKPTDERPIWGLCTFSFAQTLGALPPRMRSMGDELNDQILKRRMGLWKDWAAFLNNRFKEVGMEFDVRKMRVRLVDLRDLNLRYVNGEFVEYRWPKGRGG